MDISETWRRIEGWEIYEISSLGRVRTMAHVDSRGGYRKEKLRKLVPDKAGYLTCKLNNPEKSCKVHRLVATAFIPNPESKREVNHLDFDKANNKVENLEWVTPKENTKHAVDAGRLDNRVAWNKGLTKATDSRVAQYAEKLKGPRNG